ncbi:MAG TPA: FHIPEP family type III secretion protein, partial [Myxococcales bacterium]|nr:FHIPEP family type III secretion protein [Myxococcales bacterium]
RDLKTILEAVADAAPRSKDIGFLVEQVRRRLSRQITQRLADPQGIVRAITMDRAMEDALRSSLASSDGEAVLGPDVATAQSLVNSMQARAQQLATAGWPAVVLAPPDLRRPLFDFLARFVPDLWVVTARELAAGTSIEPAATVTLKP